MNRIATVLTIAALVGVTAVSMFGAGFAAGHLSGAGGPLTFLVGGGTQPEAGGTPGDLAETFGPFWQAWDIVHREYAEQPVDDVALMRGAIRGMLQALGDPHTGYMTPEEMAIANTHLDGDFEGIGATVETDALTGYTRIVSPIAGSPAEAAGLLAGDLIIKINGEDIAGQDITTVVGKVRGPADSRVTLTIQREGAADLLEFTVTRARINIASVESRMLDGGLGYVKINSFGEKTGAELKEHLRDLLAQAPAGLILDLRGNPGGYLDTAIEIGRASCRERV